MKWAGKTQDVGQILARGSANAVFNVEAPKDLKAGIYPLDVVLEYTGEDRENGQAEFSFWVPVRPKADFAGSSDGAFLMPGQKKEVGIQITNTGSDEAKKLSIRLRPLYPFSTDGTVRYMETLAPGETKTLTYVITVDKEATSGGQLLGLLIDFEDKQGKKYSDSPDFAMEVRMPTLVDDLFAYWYLVVMAIAAAVYFARKRGKKPGRK
ncbi:TPA: hypothetical protein HA225_02560 [Candidatus Micrarchaeota archaeon]|nr:hypothetical protein [Candidatus Micrarchaeota archaeon]